MKIISGVARRLDKLLPPSKTSCDAKDALAMTQLSSLEEGYVPWSGSAIRPSALVSILNDIVINRRTSIVECGGGVSTLYIGRLLNQRGGRLVTIEHDEVWSSMLRNILEEEGLQDVVTVIHAPMSDSHHALEGNQWYEERAVSEALSGQRIDLLLVDGPLACGPDIQLARYPALPFFAEQLDANATVVLDDIQRKGERRIARLWADEFGFHFDIRRRDGGIAIGNREKKFQV